MTTHRSFLLRAVCIAGACFSLALAGSVGCSHRYSSGDATTDGAGSATSDLIAARPSDGGMDFLRGRAFYPHAVGNRWDYRMRTRSEITTDAGPQPPQVEESALAIEITGTEQNGDHEYFLQHEFDPDAERAGNVFRMRESRFGLFELDAPSLRPAATVDVAPADPLAGDLAAYVDRTVTDPARRAAFQRAVALVLAKVAAARPVARGQQQRPGAEPGEITLLRYPLYVGARWVVRGDPRFARIVVGLERVNLPLATVPAWKLRGTAEHFGPEDRVHFWYSNLGLVRIRFHVVGDAVDDGGHVIGRVTTDSDQSLTRIHLEGRTATAGLAGGD